jgi:hypothetical protein
MKKLCFGLLLLVSGCSPATPPAPAALEDTSNLGGGSTAVAAVAGAGIWMQISTSVLWGWNARLINRDEPLPPL